MKAIFCKKCKWNKNGWCNKYECNGKKRVEVCDKYKDDEDDIKTTQSNIYKVKDIIEYKSNMTIKREGKIVAKFKVLEDEFGAEGEIVYLVEYNPRCMEEIVFEEEIIKKIK